jgi:hypothetical protein
MSRTETTLSDIEKLRTRLQVFNPSLTIQRFERLQCDRTVTRNEAIQSH